MHDFKVLILGSDANAYYMARCYHEAFHKKAHLIAKSPLAFTKTSQILTIEYFDELWDEEKFVAKVNSYAESFKKEKILIVSTNETYSSFIAKNKDRLAPNLVYNDQEISVISSLMSKEKFYKKYESKGLSFPQTSYYNKTAKDAFPRMNYPLVIKPSNVIAYNHLTFAGKNKIYKVNSFAEAQEITDKIYSSGYTDSLIFQEYIEGDDSYLFDSVVYVDRHHKVKVISFAQIGLQEHTKNMVGNAAVLINGYSSFPNAPIEDMKKKIINFMESLPYSGFAEVDMKYDAKKGEFKVLEINARQGRCSYYLTGLGANLVRLLADDLIYKKNLPFMDLTSPVLLSFVPKNVARKYIVNKEFKEKALSLWKDRLSPMEYPADTSLERFLMLKRRLWNYNREYKNAYWSNEEGE